MGTTGACFLLTAALGANFPCFCPEFEYYGGMVGLRHDSNCYDATSAWDPNLSDIQFCDNGQPDPCDCQSARKADNRLKSPPLKAPIDLSKPDSAKPKHEELFVVYLHLVDDKMKVKAHQLLIRRPGHPALVRWAGVQIKEFPEGATPTPLRRIHCAQQLGKDQYKATPDAGQIQARLAIPPQPSFVILASTTIPCDAP